MSEMVERVALVLQDQLPWADGQLHPFELSALRPVAALLVEAMREPTDTMHWAGLRDRVNYGGVSDTWRAMIDAALK